MKPMRGFSKQLVSRHSNWAIPAVDSMKRRINQRKEKYENSYWTLSKHIVEIPSSHLMGWPKYKIPSISVILDTFNRHNLHQIYVYKWFPTTYESENDISQHNQGGKLHIRIVAMTTSVSSRDLIEIKQGIISNFYKIYLCCTWKAIYCS